MKKCSKCRHVKSTHEFATDRTRSDGKNAWCRLCCKRQRAKDPARVSDRLAKWRERNPDYQKSWKLRQYGLSLEDKQRMFGEQEGKCAVCFSEMIFSAAHVDHCHASGKVRKLLCVKCNIGLGMFNDSPQALEAAARYVKEHARG